jgi:CRP/FNR family transcriptional regulator
MSNVVSAQNNFRTLGRSRFFDALLAEDLNELELLTHFAPYPAGTVLFAEEEEPQEVFLLLEGRVKLTVNSMDGKRFFFRVAEPGEVMGLASALTGASHEMTAETLHTCRLGSIKRADFLDFLTGHPEVLRSAALAVASDYNQACSRFRTLGGTPSVTAKLARLLLELSTAYGTQTERGTRLHLSLTHGDIGECIGACRESVSRSFRDLRSRDLIALHGSIVTIPNRASLEACAGS